VGNGEEGTPVIGEAIESARRHGRIASREGIKIVLGRSYTKFRVSGQRNLRG
jgi:hypothetical protein